MKRTPWYLCGLALMLLTSTCFASAVQKEALFLDFEAEPSSAGASRATEGLGQAVQATYRATINLEALVLPRGSGSTRDHGRPESGQSLRVRFPGDRGGRTLLVETVHEWQDVRTYTGRVEGEPDSMFAVSVEGDSILAKVHIADRTYVTVGESDNYTVFPVDRARLPRAPEPIYDPPRKNKSQRAPASQKMLTNGNVKMLVMYSPAVASAFNVNTLAASIVSEFNSSLSASGVASSNYLTLSGLVEINDNFTNVCKDVIRNNARNRQGVFSDLDARMTNWGADVAMYIVTTEEGYTHCDFGLGRVGGIAGGQLDDSQPFAIQTDTSAIGDLTALHEIGHVLGGMHDVVQFGECPLGLCQADARGHVNSGQWQTVMGGYFQDCLYGSSCIRIPRWSNPSITWGGVATGVVNVSHMARTLGIDMPVVSGWTADPSPPGTPSFFNVQPEWCYGSHELSWGSQSTATQYRVYRSAYSNFSSQTLVYEGPSTNLFLNVPPPGTSYLRAQACNGGGCSSYTATATATYFNGCL